MIVCLHAFGGVWNWCIIHHAHVLLGFCSSSQETVCGKFLITQCLKLMRMFAYIFLLSLKLSSSNRLSSLWIVLPSPLSYSAPWLHLLPLWDVSVTITHGVHGPIAAIPVTMVPKHVQGNHYLTYFWCAKLIILICTFVCCRAVRHDEHWIKNNCVQFCQTHETRACSVEACPIHCQLTEFGPWSECSPCAKKSVSKTYRY